jgi:hypothetical protein
MLFFRVIQKCNLAFATECLRAVPFKYTWEGERHLFQTPVYVAMWLEKIGLRSLSPIFEGNFGLPKEDGLSWGGLSRQVLLY